MEDKQMKKFIIISTILILVAAGLFGYSLYHYLDVTGALVRNTNAAATADTVWTVNHRFP